MLLYMGNLRDQQRRQQALEEAVVNLEGLAEQDRAAWEKAIYYLYLLVHHRRKSKEGERLKEKIQDKVRVTRGRKAAQVMARTLAEQLMEEGFDRGMIKAKQDVLLGLMVEKFGTVPERIIKRVRSLQDTETLDRLLRLLIHASSLDEMELQPQ